LRVLVQTLPLAPGEREQRKKSLIFKQWHSGIMLSPSYQGQGFKSSHGDWCKEKETAESLKFKGTWYSGIMLTPSLQGKFFKSNHRDWCKEIEYGKKLKI
jgi:hypothetical protein